MQPRLEMIPARHYVGLGTRFISILSPDANSMLLLPALWERFVPRLGEVRARVEAATYGLCFTLGDEAAREHEHELFYLACVEVDDPTHVPAGMERRTVAGGPHFVCTHKGPLAGLGETLRRVHEEWLPASGHTLRDAPHLEIYDDRFDPEAPDSELDLALPVAR